MKDVMRFWLDMGCDGFRVDMADSLVKEDDLHEDNILPEAFHPEVAFVVAEAVKSHI